jgi:hypothetical protein
VTGALAANNSAGAVVGSGGAPFGTAAGLAATALGISTQHRGSVLWAWKMATEAAIEAANASQRPRPLANRALLTNSRLLACPL